MRILAPMIWILRMGLTHWRFLSVALSLGLSMLMAFDIATALKLEGWPTAMAERIQQDRQVEQVVKSRSGSSKYRPPKVRSGPVASYQATYRYQVHDAYYELVTDWRKQDWPQRTAIYHHPHSPARSVAVKPEVNIGHWIVFVAGLGAAGWLLRTPWGFTRASQPA